MTGRPSAQECSIAARKNSGQVTSLDARRAMADPINAAMFAQ
jgi:hypothetical protein